jgi:hypothetical protein
VQEYQGWVTADASAEPSDKAIMAQPADSSIITIFETLPRLLEADTQLLGAGRWLNVDCLLGPTAQPLLVSIREGHISEMSIPKTMPSWRFSYTASPRAWIEYWRAEPKPGWHDLLALTKRGEAHVAGDLHPFMTHLQYFKDLLALPRSMVSGKSA